MNSKTINQIFQIFSNNNPTPKTELEFTSNFTLSVAVILSARATDISVNKATKNFLPSYDTPKKILSLGENGLKKYIKTIGLYNSKAKNVIALCKILIDKYNSNIPSEFDELIKLPGIGRKTAQDICDKLKIKYSKKVSELSEEQLDKIRDELKNFQIEGDLRREVGLNIKRLKDLGCYRGIRHRKSLPCRGQRTHTNARTRKGKKVSIAGKKSIKSMK